jgi:hypothetical protein
MKEFWHTGRRILILSNQYLLYFADIVYWQSVQVAVKLFYPDKVFSFKNGIQPVTLSLSFTISGIILKNCKKYLQLLITYLTGYN